MCDQSGSIKRALYKTYMFDLLSMNRPSVALKRSGTTRNSQGTQGRSGRTHRWREITAILGTTRHALSVYLDIRAQQYCMGFVVA